MHLIQLASSATATLALLTSSALAQTISVDRTYTDAANDTASGVSAGTQVFAVIQNWGERVAFSPDVLLTSVETSTPLSMSASFTVRNPTATAFTGLVRLQYSYFAAGGFGTWGGSDGTGTRAATVQVTDLQPGETRVLQPWTLGRGFATSHNPMSIQAGFWSDVSGSCVGSGAIPFSVTASLELVGPEPPFMEIVSADLVADVSGELRLNADLASASQASSYCPAPVNSSGGPGTLAAFGALDAGTSDFALVAEGMPANTFSAIFLASQQGSVVISGGTICLGGQRLLGTPPAATGPLGRAVFEVDLGPYASGTTIFAQGFFRDVNVGIGVTSALELPLL